MNLLLFETTQGRVLPVGERRPAGPDPSPAAGDSRWQRLKQQVVDAYRKLKDQFDYWEGLCADLRHADGVRVVHPSSLSADDAQKKLRDFFDSSYSKHGRWLVVDGVLAGLGAILTPIPGPNIFFFYPAVRALSHYFARAGAARASRLKPTFERLPRPSLF